MHHPSSSGARLGRLRVALLLAITMACPASHAATAAPVHAAPSTRAEGTLEILVEDHARFSRTRHFLKTERGRLELQFKGGRPPASLRSGARLRVNGVQTGDLLALSTTDASALTVTAAAPPLANTLGEQKTAVLLVNFLDDGRQPYTLAQANEVVFAQTSGFLKENSFQKTWLAGQTYGWYTLPIVRTCNGFDIAFHAREAAANAGIDLAGYTRFIYVAPANPACGWNGQALLGGSISYLWVNGSLNLHVVGHELGHNFGLYHSHSSECGAAVFGTSCTSWDYGDPVDIMGINAPTHYNAFQKERLGWLNAAAQPPIATVQASGSYTIDAYAAAAGGNPKALKILKSTDQSTGARTWYYVEYRQPVGYDAVLSGFPASNYTGGLLVRTGSDAGGNTSFALDMTPGSADNDWGDPALGFGQSFSDADSGVSIHAVAGYGANARVDVGLAQPAGCAMAAPLLALSGGTQPVPAGTAVSYAVSLTNKDGAGCAAATFNLNSTLPTGWSGGFANGTLIVAPGASAQTSLSVTSASSTAAGSYSIGASASNAVATQYTGSGSAVQTVGGGTLSTSVATSRTLYSTRDTIVATATVLAGTTPLANASVVFVFVKPDGGSVVKNALSDAKGLASASYRLSRKEPTGAWQVNEVATQGLAQASASAGFVVGR